MDIDAAVTQLTIDFTLEDGTTSHLESQVEEK